MSHYLHRSTTAAGKLQKLDELVVVTETQMVMMIATLPSSEMDTLFRRVTVGRYRTVLVSARALPVPRKDTVAMRGGSTRTDIALTNVTPYFKVPMSSKPQRAGSRHSRIVWCL